MPTTAIIGYGLLGSAIAEMLVAAGHRVSAYDIDATRRDAALACGVTAEASSQAVVASSDRILLSLPNSQITATVLTEIAPSLHAGAIILDTTTSDPEHAEAFAAQLERAGVSYLETNVGGSSDQVRRHDAIVICGGPPKAYSDCSEFLGLLFRRSFYVGTAGAANRMKLVLNLVLGLNRAVLAEGLGFAIANGIDPRTALEILRVGPAYSRVMDTKGSKMIDADFTAQAYLAQHLKDVHLILTLGETSGAKLPFSRLHREILETLEQAGYGREDNSAIIRAFLREPAD